MRVTLNYLFFSYKPPSIKQATKTLNSINEFAKLHFETIKIININGEGWIEEWYDEISFRYTSNSNTLKLNLINDSDFELDSSDNEIKLSREFEDGTLEIIKMNTLLNTGKYYFNHE